VVVSAEIKHRAKMSWRFDASAGHADARQRGCPPGAARAREAAFQVAEAGKPQARLHVADSQIPSASEGGVAPRRRKHFIVF